MKKVIIITMIILLLVGLVMAPPPGFDSSPGKAPAKAGKAGTPTNEFFSVSAGKNVPKSYAAAIVKKNTIPKDLVSSDCRKNIATCSQQEFDKIWNNEKVDYKVKYDPSTHTFENPSSRISRVTGKFVKFSDDGKYSVSDTGIILDYSDKDLRPVGILPSDKKFTDIVKVEPHVITFKDDTVMVGKAVIPKSVHQLYSSQYNPEKLASSTGTDGNYKIPLRFGGEISADTSYGITTTTVKLVAEKNGEPEETKVYTTPDGTEYDPDDWEVVGNTLKEKNGDETVEITIYRYGDYGIFKKDGDTLTEIIQKGGDDVTTISHDSDGKVSDVVIRGKDGKVKGKSDIIKDGVVESMRFFDANGDLKSICHGNNCMNNPDNTDMTYVYTNGVCIGTKDDCKTGENSHNFISEDALENPEKCNIAGTKCKQLSEEERKQALSDQNSKDTEQLLSNIADAITGNNKYSQTIGKILRVRPNRWRATSSWLFPDLTKDMNKLAAQTFDQVLLVDYKVPKAVCDYDQAHKTQRPGSSSTFIEISPGVVQFTGSIQAEKTPDASPMLCGGELECQIGECINEVCMEDDQVVFGTFYKITWAVQAPQDEKHTPYLDENGVAISYNVQIQGERNFYLYPADKPGTKTSLKLDNGGSDRDTFITYSTNDYDSVCILFGQSPSDLAGEEVKEICADFIISTQGLIEWDTSGRGGSSSSSSTSAATTVTVSDQGRKQI